MNKLIDKVKEMNKSDKDWLRQTLTDLILGLIFLILDKIIK